MLALDPIENVFIILFMAGPKSVLEATRFAQIGAHIIGRNRRRNNRTTSFGEKVCLFAYIFTYVSTATANKQLLSRSDAK